MLTLETEQACTYARFLCEKAGVKFVLGDPQGKLQRLVSTEQSSEKKVTGIETCDGRVHRADFVVVAGMSLDCIPAILASHS